MDRKVIEHCTVVIIFLFPSYVELSLLGYFSQGTVCYHQLKPPM